jgi:murein DD-endopeptidase MepM/ murein hydrolase activator NlpD
MRARNLPFALALALAGCATAPQLGARGVPPPSAARLRADDDGVSPQPPLPAEPELAASATVSGDALRRRLVQFVAEAQLAREAALPGDAMPNAQLVRWERVQTEVERFLAAEATTDDLSAVRALVQAVLDLDVRTYQDVPEPLLEGLDARLARLEARFAQVSHGSVHRSGYRWPLSTVCVTSPFGKRLHPIKRRWRLHSGVDLVADANEPVLAAGAGLVVRAGWNAGYGYEVEIQHADGLMTRYSHLTAPLVLEGTPVQSGDALGLAGRTGTATGVHLHFEFLRSGVPRDPLKEFRKLVGTPAPRVVILAPPHHRALRKAQDLHAAEPGA